MACSSFVTLRACEATKTSRATRALGAGAPLRSGVTSGTPRPSGAAGTSDAADASRALRAICTRPAHHAARSSRTVEAVVALGTRQSSSSSGTVIAFVTSRARRTRASVQPVATRGSIFTVPATVDPFGAWRSGFARAAIESTAAAWPSGALGTFETGFAGQAAGTRNGLEILESNNHFVESRHVRSLLLSEFGYCNSVCGFAGQRLAKLRLEKRV